MSEVLLSKLDYTVIMNVDMAKTLMFAVNFAVEMGHVVSKKIKVGLFV